MNDESAPSPSPPAPHLPGPGIARSIALCAVFYIVFVAAAALQGLLLGLLGQSGELRLDMFSAILVPQIVAWLITIRLGLQWAGVSFRTACPLKPFPIRIVPALLVASFGAIILLTEAAGMIPMPESVRQSIIEEFKSGNKLVMFVVGVVVAPLAEEMFFRGLVLRGYLGRYSVTKAVWASAILFAMFHLNPWQAVTALPLGIWFAWMVLRTGSVLPGILGHAMVNFTGFFLLGWIAQAWGYSAEEFIELAHLPLSMLAVGGAMTVLGGYILWRQLASIPSRRGEFSIDSATGPNEPVLSNPEP